MNFNARTLILCAITFAVVGALCVTALVVSGLVSPQRITDSILNDRERIEQRGDYPIFFSETPKYRYDGFTDSLMLMQAIPHSDMTALENAVLAPYHAIGDGTPGGDGTGGVSPTRALVSLISNPDVEQQRSYVLYWHGYVVPMRVLLTFLSPMSIIVLNCIIFTLLAALVFEAFRRMGGLAYSVAFVVALLATFAWITPLGFTHFTAFHLSFVATLMLYWLLQCSERQTWIVPFFLAVGMLIAFFDFFTVPLLTFLLPLTLYLVWLIKVRQESSLLKMVSTGAAWLVGYAGFWASKWLMTAFVYSAEYANSEFVRAISLRSSSGEEGIVYRFAAIYNNLYQLFAIHPDGSMSMEEFFVIVAVVALALAAVWWLAIKKTQTSTDQIKLALPMLLVALGPYVWYFVVSQHSTFHSWFTWRLQTASIIAVIFFVLLSIDWSNFVREKPAKVLAKEGKRG